MERDDAIRLQKVTNYEYEGPGAPKEIKETFESSNLRRYYDGSLCDLPANSITMFNVTNYPLGINKLPDRTPYPISGISGQRYARAVGYLFWDTNGMKLWEVETQYQYAQTVLLLTRNEIDEERIIGLQGVHLVQRVGPGLAYKRRDGKIVHPEQYGTGTFYYLALLNGAVSTKGWQWDGPMKI